jgi:hypothetical protein
MSIYGGSDSLTAPETSGGGGSTPDVKLAAKLNVSPLTIKIAAGAPHHTHCSSFKNISISPIGG